jgi:hypothetical protein
MTPNVLAPGSKKWIERFLTDCANLPNEMSVWRETDKRAEKVIARYPDVFAGIELKDNEGQETRTSHGIGVIAHDLRRIWDAPNLWARNWYIYKLANFYHGAKAETEYLRPYGGKDPGSFDDVIAATEEPPPANDPFMLALVHLQRTDKARHCPNTTCAAPYFFATKHRQKHCTPECASECTREQKRKWWHSRNGGLQ